MKKIGASVNRTWLRKQLKWGSKIELELRLLLCGLAGPFCFNDSCLTWEARNALVSFSMKAKFTGIPGVCVSVSGFFLF